VKKGLISQPIPLHMSGNWQHNGAAMMAKEIDIEKMSDEDSINSDLSSLNKSVLFL
jgi:hypothetical protein